MKKLFTLLFIFILSINTFATTVYVSNKSSVAVTGAYAKFTSDVSFGNNVLTTAIYPGYYDYFYTKYHNTYYTFAVTTSNGNQCILPSRYVTTSPLVIYVYNDRCILAEYVNG